MLGIFVGLFFLVGFFVVLPLVALGLLLRVVVGLVLLPFKLVGMVFGLVFGIAGAVFGLAIAAITVVVTLLALGTVLLIPLLPILLVVAGLYLLFRMTRPRPQLGSSI
jgi:hypothetical protein